jgi:hypothetical protein
MSYDLCFSPEFFGAGEDEDMIISDRPTTLTQAIFSLSDEKFEEIKDFMELPDTIDREYLLGLVEDTNSCTNLSSPVEVWIDPEGWCTVLVYDKTNKENKP